MKKILNFLLISLAILSIACSGPQDVMDTAIDKQKQLDQLYEDASAKLQAETPPKAKNTDVDKSKSDEAPKAKNTDADKSKSDESPKAKNTDADKSKSDESPKVKNADADKLMNEIDSKIKKATVEGTLQQLDPAKLCSAMPGNEKYMCEQKVKMDIQSEMAKNSGPLKHNKNQHPKVDPNSENPCESVPKDAKAECEKGIADMRKETEAAKAKEAEIAKLEADKYIKNFDPNNIPKIAKFNFTDLDKFSRMSKIRSAVGHNYSYKTDEDDPTRQNCKSMKHYFVPTGVPKSNELFNKTPHAFKWMSIKFYSPVDGFINHVEYSNNTYGTEANFGIQATDTDAKGYYFDYYHISLDSNLKVGSVVKAGQQVGTLGDENAYGEIAVSARMSKTKIHLISFLEVATDEIYNLYKNRGVNSPSDVIITRAERDANPLPCDNSEAGWFLGSSKSNKPDITFQNWVFESEDNWFFFK